jgi:hypothetical protein
MRGQTLSELVRQLRAETGQSTSAAVGMEYADQLKQIIKRKQETLYDKHDWAFLRTFAEIQLFAGQRLYSFPSNMNLERVEEVQASYSGEWLPLTYGIGVDQYNSLDSIGRKASGYFEITAGTAGGGNKVSAITVNGLAVINSAVAWVTSNEATATAIAAAINATVTFPQYSATSSGNRVTIYAPEALGADADGYVIAVTVGGTVTVSTPSAMDGGVTVSRNDPVQRWQIIDVDGTPYLEVWPVPASSYYMRLVGIRNLNPLVADADRADLDDSLIVLWSAAEVLAGKSGGEAKVRLAMQRESELRARLSKGAVFGIGGNAGSVPRRREVVVRVAGAA